MKEIALIVLVSITIIGCNGKRTSNHRTANSIKKIDTLALVKSINHYKLKIDSIKPTLDSLNKDIYKSAEGGIVKLFYNNQSDTLKKEVIYYGETGKRLLDIYLKENKPVLIEDVTVHYKKPIAIHKEV